MSLPRVRLVEDDASIRRWVALTLEDDGVELVQADLAAQVENCAARQRADTAWAQWPALRARLPAHAQPGTESGT
jgi:DNA-binding response OmpR family regulator